MSTDTTTIDVSEKGIQTTTASNISSFGFFWLTFLGYSFLCKKEKKILSKTQVYHRDPILAVQMAQTLLVPKDYIIVNSVGWLNGIYQE